MYKTGSNLKGFKMKKITLNHVAKAATGVALAALVAGQWALITGPVEALGEQGRIAAEHANFGDFATYAGLHLLMLIGLPLVFGAIAFCVLAAYTAFARMESLGSRQLAVFHETD